MRVGRAVPEVVWQEREEQARSHGHLPPYPELPEHEQSRPGRHEVRRQVEQVACQKRVARQGRQHLHAQEQGVLTVREVVQLHHPRGTKPGVLQVPAVVGDPLEHRQMERHISADSVVQRNPDVSPAQIESRDEDRHADPIGGNRRIEDALHPRALDRPGWSWPRMLAGDRPRPRRRRPHDPGGRHDHCVRTAGLGLPGRRRRGVTLAQRSPGSTDRPRPGWIWWGRSAVSVF